MLQELQLGTTQRQEGKLIKLIYIILKIPIKNVIFMPYVFRYHCRLLIVNIEEKSLTLVDPLLGSTDHGRLAEKFTIFIKNCAPNSSFSILKSIRWSISDYSGKRLYQTDSSNCGIYIMYIMNSIACNTEMNVIY